MNDMTFNPSALDRGLLLSALRGFRKGDFSVRLPMDMAGMDGEIAIAFNDIAEMNETLADEFMRIRDEVGKEGQINQRVKLRAATGGWADSIDSINNLIGNLVRPTSEVARVIESVAKGDLSQTMLLEIDGRPLKGEFLRIGNVVNTMVEQLNGFASEVTRVAREVGTDGRLGGQAQVTGVAGTWKDLTDNVNLMAANLTGQVRNIAEVTTAVAKGDLSKKITVGVKGEILELKSTINTMVDQLNGFASEVTRVAREVGTEGKLGGQAQVPGVAGTWKDLTDNVNAMAANLTGQVRNIAEVTTAVAKGDLSKKITVNVKGEILELKSTINTMVDQLNGFASEVTRVAREVGTDGRLGGQAQVPGVAGTWKDLTDNVNLMAAHVEEMARSLAQIHVQACGISHVAPSHAQPKLLLAIDTALSEPLPASSQTQAIDFEVINANLWPMANTLYRRVEEPEMLNNQLHQNVSERDARLEVSRYALTQEVTKRIGAEKELTQANFNLRVLAARDSLTGLFNRRYLEESLDREESRARRSGQPLGVMMIDIDHFKQCNDTFGHAAGDEVLRAVGHYLQSLGRAEDIFCRYGGEEFLLLMANTSPATLLERAEGLRQGVEKLKIEQGGRALGPITLSAGISLFPDHGKRIDQVLKAADTALYQAKQDGRNRVVIAQGVS